MKLAIFVLATLYFVQGLEEQQHSIRAGDCTNRTVDDLLHSEVVKKFGVILLVQEAEVTYYGDDIIGCITAEDPNNQNSLAEIVSGGVNHKYTTVHFQSGWGRSLFYTLKIYKKA